MEHHDETQFIDIELSELIDTVAKLKEEGYAFVQLCASTLDGPCEMLYTFTEPEREGIDLVGYNLIVPEGATVPSITEYYPAAFVFENETHDLFGIKIKGINLDYEGQFYSVPVAYPMNPRAALREEDAQENVKEDAANE